MIWCGSGIVIAGIFWLPGFSPVDRSIYLANPSNPSTFSSSFVPGRIDGWALAFVLWAALLVLALGMILTLSVISRRRPLQGLSNSNNVLLRTIAMNRALRIGALLSCGVASFAVQFATRRSGLETPGGSDSLSIWSVPQGIYRIVGLLIVVLVIASQPPKLDPLNGRDTAEEILDSLLRRQHKAEFDAIESSNAARI